MNADVLDIVFRAPPILSYIQKPALGDVTAARSKDNRCHIIRRLLGKWGVVHPLHTANNRGELVTAQMSDVLPSESSEWLNHPELKWEMLVDFGASFQFAWKKSLKTRHPGKLTWNIVMEVWKMIFLFNWVFFCSMLIFRGVPGNKESSPSLI